MEKSSQQLWQEQWDKDKAAFHALVGHCITEWANADEALFQIFSDAVGQYEQCAIIFYRLPGLDVRLGMTDEVVLSVLPRRERKSGGHDHPDVIRWKKIAKQFKELLSIRRRIAHQPVHVSIWQRAGLASDDPDQTFSTGFEIYTSVHERVREIGSAFMDDYDKPALTASDLEEHLKAVGEVVLSLRSFLREVKPKPPK